MLAAAEVRGIFSPDALFETSSNTGMGLGTADQVRESDTRSVSRIEGIFPTREEAAYSHVTEGRLTSGMEFCAGRKEKLLDYDVVASLIVQARPGRGVLRPQDQIYSGLGVEAQEFNIRTT